MERYNLSGQQAMSSGKAVDAEQAFRLALAEAEKLGTYDPKVAISCVNLANCLRMQGRYADAEPLYKQAIVVKDKAFGPLHKELIPVLDNYAKMLRAAGRTARGRKNGTESKNSFCKTVRCREIVKKLAESSWQDKPHVSTDLTALDYQSGFGNHFESEGEPGTLPKGQNSPQKVARGLYAEQLSGSSFTANRAENLRSWLYRIRPSVLHSKFAKYNQGLWRGKPFSEAFTTPEQLRWDPLPTPTEPTDFIDGVATIAGNGDSASWRGCATHIYAINESMHRRFFYNADGEMLFVPESGALRMRTEFGDIDVRPGEIAVIPRGIKFQVQLHERTARGYICENYGPPLRLPTLGVIGANGLANPRDFQSPVAKFERLDEPQQLIAKFNSQLWSTQLNHSPLDVVAWHGNYVPYKYDLSLFQAVNTVTFDHSDPSIFTVLTSPSEVPGFANVDFVIFPPRWLVAEHTFRPPYFHRNMMSEYMGLIFGVYDAKEEGFVPGGGSLHNCMSAHGPDADTFARASSAELAPKYLADTLAFMFESSLIFHPTEYALNSELLQNSYLDCWSGLKANFSQE